MYLVFYTHWHLLCTNWLNHEGTSFKDIHKIWNVIQEKKITIYYFQNTEPTTIIFSIFKKSLSTRDFNCDQILYHDGACWIKLWAGANN